MNAMDVALICKALGDANRLEIVQMLSDGEKCGCKLLERFEITQPTLFHDEFSGNIVANSYFKFYIWFLFNRINTTLSSILKYRKHSFYHEFTTIEWALIWYSKNMGDTTNLLRNSHVFLITNILIPLQVSLHLPYIRDKQSHIKQYFLFL